MLLLFNPPVISPISSTRLQLSMPGYSTIICSGVSCSDPVSSVIFGLRGKVGEEDIWLWLAELERGESRRIWPSQWKWAAADYPVIIYCVHSSGPDYFNSYSCDI